MFDLLITICSNALLDDLRFLVVAQLLELVCQLIVSVFQACNPLVLLNDPIEYEKPESALVF